MVSRPQVLVVTGMSGAGRSTAAKVLEDLGYLVVDNLPPALIGEIVRFNDLADVPRRLAYIRFAVDGASRMQTMIEDLLAYFYKKEKIIVKGRRRSPPAAAPAGSRRRSCSSMLRMTCSSGVTRRIAGPTRWVVTRWRSRSSPSGRCLRNCGPRRNRGARK